MNECTYYTYREKRGSTFMDKNDDSGNANNIIQLNNFSGSEDTGDTKQTQKKYFDKQAIVSTIIGGLVYSIILAIAAFWLNLYTIPEDIREIKSQIVELNNDVSHIGDRIDNEINDRANADSDIKNQILAMALSPMLRPTNTCSKAITQKYNDWESPYKSDKGQLTPVTLVAYNKDTNEQYSAMQLADQKLLLPYMSGEQEVYFYGQFSESGQWDGNCITNVYKNDKLSLITDAVYDNGRLLQYKQIFSYTLRSGQEVWAFADRTQEDGFSSGVTWLYERTADNDYTKDFTFNSVTADRIYTAEQFKEKISEHLYAFYHGNISNGYFNDTTGTAYMVFFFNDGKVRLLYSGNFKNGLFNDSTGNAWYIVKDINTDYMYAKGSFQNGDIVPSRVSEKGPPPLGLEEIENYMSQREFDFPFELEWAGFDLL